MLVAQLLPEEWPTTATTAATTRLPAATATTAATSDPFAPPDSDPTQLEIRPS